MVKYVVGEGRAKLINTTRSLSGSKVQVGIFSEAGTHPDSGMSYASLMYLQEVKGVRSKDGYIRRRAFEITSKLHGKQLMNATMQKIKSAYSSGATGEQALTVFGKGLADSIKSVFGNPSILPGNALSTLRLKDGRNTPLVDSGELREKIKFKVVQK